MRLVIILTLISAVICCKPTDSKVQVQQTDVVDIQQERVDSVYMSPESITLNFKLKYTTELLEEYMRSPDPGEDDNYPAIFSVDERFLSIHSPIYQTEAPNYFTYHRGDSLVYESAR